jgi:hypothetical protein
MLAKPPIFTLLCLLGLLFGLAVVGSRWLSPRALWSYVGDMGHFVAALPTSSAAPNARDATPTASPSLAAASGAAAPSVRPDALLNRTTQLFETCSSVAARIYVAVNIYGQSLLGSGVYLEQDRVHAHRMRLELNIQHGDRAFTLLQVCDGRYLWVYRLQGEHPELTRIDMAEINRASQLHRGQSCWPPLAGLAKLLDGLRADFDFVAVEDFRLPQWPPLWRLRGHWKREQLARMLPAQSAAITAGKAADLTKLPEQFPDQVVLYVGQQNAFPYRLEYRHTLPGGRAARGGDRPSTLLMAMQLIDVALNVPIAPVRFSYSPPADIPYAEKTNEWLGYLGLSAAK